MVVVAKANECKCCNANVKCNNRIMYGNSKVQFYIGCLVDRYNLDIWIIDGFSTCKSSGWRGKHPVLISVIISLIFYDVLIKF